MLLFKFFFKKNREMLLFKLFVDIIRRKYQLNLIKVLFYLYIKKNQKKKKNKQTRTMDFRPVFGIVWITVKLMFQHLQLMVSTNYEKKKTLKEMQHFTWFNEKYTYKKKMYLQQFLFFILNNLIIRNERI